jgi:hypothetical protein
VPWSVTFDQLDAPGPNIQTAASAAILGLALKSEAAIYASSRRLVKRFHGALPLHTRFA